MSVKDQAAAIAAAVRASLLIAAEHGMTIEQFLAESGDRVIGNNAAQVLQTPADAPAAKLVDVETDAAETLDMDVED